MFPNIIPWLHKDFTEGCTVFDEAMQAEATSGGEKKNTSATGWCKQSHSTDTQSIRSYFLKDASTWLKSCQSAMET